jgi:hypothetical protein
MAPRIDSIVGDDAADHTFAQVEAPYSHRGIHDTKGPKPQPREIRTDHRGDEEHHSRHDMQYVVRDVDHEDTEIEPVPDNAGHESQQSAEKEGTSHQNSQASDDHGDFVPYFDYRDRSRSRPFRDQFPLGKGTVTLGDHILIRARPPY